MINTIWQGFPGFLIAFLIKRLLYIEIRVFRKKKKGTGGAERPKWAIAHFRVSVATRISLAGCFWVATKAFLVVTKPSCSMSRHGFPCVAT